MLYIKSWFLNKENHLNTVYCNAEDVTILKETEKALNIKIFTKFGDECFWIPKSVVEQEPTNEDIINDYNQLMNKGLEKYMKLYNFALSSGVKVRKRTSTAKILLALEEAGIKYNY